MARLSVALEMPGGFGLDNQFFLLHRAACQLFLKELFCLASLSPAAVATALGLHRFVGSDLDILHSPFEEGRPDFLVVVIDADKAIVCPKGEGLFVWAKVAFDTGEDALGLSLRIVRHHVDRASERGIGDAIREAQHGAADVGFLVEMHYPEQDQALLRGEVAERLQEAAHVACH